MNKRLIVSLFYLITGAGVCLIFLGLYMLMQYQAGLVLSGDLVKLIRERKLTLQGVFIIFQHGRLEMIGLQYLNKNYNIPLMLNQKEISEIIGQIGQKQISCVPLNIKRVGRWFKSEIAIVKGKKTYDKRESIKKRDVDRDLSRSLKD